MGFYYFAVIITLMMADTLLGWYIQGCTTLLSSVDYGILAFYDSIFAIKQLAASVVDIYKPAFRAVSYIGS